MFTIIPATTKLAERGIPYPSAGTRRRAAGRLCCVLALMLLALNPPAVPAGVVRPQELQAALRSRLECAGRLPLLGVACEKVHTSAMLPRFYSARAYEPAWILAEGLRPQALALLASLGRACEDGLNPADYHQAAIAERLGGPSAAPVAVENLPETELVDLELLLTDAFLVYAAHLVGGRVNPETFDPEWVAERREVDLTFVLEQALARDRVAEALADLLPRGRDYAGLKAALARYRQIQAAGGWPALSGGPVLKPGMREPRVADLRSRLAAEGLLVATADPEFYDAALGRAVRGFQQSRGLAPDGHVGPQTLAVLNVPVEARVRTLELNLERWRWLPQDLGARHVRVNMAAFQLGVYEAGTEVLALRVIVGQDYRRTPVFSGRITYLVLNPYWEVPPRIAVEDKLPLIRRDPHYLARQKIRVFRGWGPEAREVDPADVDWSRLHAGNFPYHLRQDPGPENALGRIKFMFPNRFNVYLHDTPARDLFGKTERAFSSGCIRVEDPLELAAYLLEDDPRWTPEALAEAIGTGAEQRVTLPNPVPVHLLYLTAFVDDDGVLNFRKDLYGRDRLLAEAFYRPPPGP